MFYAFIQNNVGGEFIVNDDVACYLIVEADTAIEATEKAEYITDGYQDYCECCGDRWDLDVFEKDATDKPMAYNIDVRERKVYPGFSDNETIIYYKDGSKEKLWYD